MVFPLELVNPTLNSITHSVNHIFGYQILRFNKTHTTIWKGAAIKIARFIVPFLAANFFCVKYLSKKTIAAFFYFQ
jgi:hypothetical protein